MTPKYHIGQKVFWATHSTRETSIVCPDCQGDMFLTVIFKDYTTCTIPCRTCESGYRGSLGRLYFPEYYYQVEEREIKGVDTCCDKIEYKLGTESTCSYYCVDENDLFTTKAEAEERAKELTEQQNEKESQRHTHKVKDHRSWAWNVNYHRGEIRRMKKSIEYHEKQLDYAKTKAKDGTV